MASGIETARFGAWLSETLHETCAGGGRRVFYDHGNKAHDPNVAALQGFLGEELKNMNRLADIDVAVVDAQGRVEILIEIEESSSPPKKIIGDVFAVAMCNRVAVKQEHGRKTFDITPSTILFVVGIANPKGHKLAQVQEVIEPRVCQFGAPDGGFRLVNTRFVFEANIELAIKELKQLVLKELGCQKPAG